jgi:hypothetical protein
MRMNGRVTFLVLVFAVVVEAQSNFFFNILTYLLGPLLEFLVRSTCRTILGTFNDILDCRCRGIYSSFEEGIGGKVKCSLDDPVCLLYRPFRVFCGKLDSTITFNTRTGVSKIKACIDIVSDFPRDFPIPIDDVTQFPRLCVSAVPTNMEFLTFESCQIQFDNDLCSSCTVCESQRDFLFDCRNVNINPAKEVEPTFIEGPFVTECVGFSFLFAPTAMPTSQPIPAPVVVPVAAPTNATVPAAAPVVVPTNGTSPVAAPTNATVPAAAPVLVPTNATAPATAPALVPTNATAPVTINATAPVAAPMLVPTNATTPVATPTNA